MIIGITSFFSVPDNPDDFETPKKTAGEIVDVAYRFLVNRGPCVEIDIRAWGRNLELYVRHEDIDELIEQLQKAKSIPF